MLRPYQRECLEEIASAWRQGTTRQLVVLPTGTGKTLVAAHLPEYVPLRGRRLMFLVHLDVLAFQAAEKFTQRNPHLKVGIEKAELRAPEDADVVVASVQTLGRNGSRRLAATEPSSFGLCYIDECFPAGTLVDGRPIESFVVGDPVRCFDHAGQRVVMGSVRRVFRRTTNALVRVRLSTGVQIVCTPNHPIYLPTHGCYREASHLRVGDWVSGFHEQQEEQFIEVAWVQALEFLERGRSSEFEQVCPNGLVYNLEVEPHPNYFASGILVHNCHHASQKQGQYVNVLRHLKLLKGDPNCRRDALLVGLTATPNRTDNVGLELIFDKIVYQRNIREMIEEGWLTDVEAWRIWTDHDIADVRTQAGDFIARDLVRSVNTPERNLLVVRKYQELGEGAPALAFTVNIEHSEDLAEMFRREGVEARAISSNTPAEDCHKIIDRFKSNELPVLVSCMKVSEGFDAPVATVGLMARPTKSTLLYSQQLGRILRPYPAPEDASSHQGYRKRRALLLDFADNTGRHNVISLATLFGLRPSFNLKGKKVTKVLAEVEELEAQYPTLDLRSAEDIEEIHSIAERINLFEPPTVPEVARRHSRYVWIQQGEDQFRLSLPDRTSLSIKENHLGQFEIYRNQTGQRALLEVAPGVVEAFLLADAYVPKDAVGAVLSTARWRRDEPTERQACALYNLDRSMRQTFGSKEELYRFILKRYSSGDLRYTRGGLSQKISSLIEARV